MLNPAKRYCSKNLWFSRESRSNKVVLKSPSIFTPHVVHVIAAVCIDRPQQGHDVESNFFAIIINISIYINKVMKNLENNIKYLIIFGFYQNFVNWLRFFKFPYSILITQYE